MKTWITSESVTEGHPDKCADQISDAILDAALEQDAESRVAVETLATTGQIIVAGEVTTKAVIDYQTVIRNTLKEIGYTDIAFGIDAEHAAILVAIHGQSPDIAQGVDETKEHEQGAGDQGMMYGFACDETPELLPLPIVLAHKLTKRLAEVRKTNVLPYLGPDGKSQASIEYVDGVPVRASAIVVSTQHREYVDIEALRNDILNHVILPVCGDWIDDDTDIYINPTGRFVIGGPQGDTGVTGRKIIVDTYGGVGRHGGGAFSGKDPSKVDRSAAYAARWVAKNIVAANLAKRCEVQVSYAIGIAEPVSIHVDTFGTGLLGDDEIAKIIKEHFDLRPKAIIHALKLKRPIYKRTASYGHFGRNEFTWEDTSKAVFLRAESLQLINRS
jgi:S-adenosylmethionine synthetase